MSEERTYLELSEEGGGSHKFYEVVVKGKELTIRYGRIGDAGQSSTKSFASPEAARAEAEKKLGEKKKKGYASAVQGERKKRAVTQRTIASAPSQSKQAPILWKFETKMPALGIFIDDRRCWMANQGGQVFALDHEGKVHMQYKLPEGVKCLVGDRHWLYAGCDDGNVYDLTGKVPRLAYSIAEDVDILWLDICGGMLAVSDGQGGVTVLDAEEEKVWDKKSKGYSGWMVRATAEAVYHGHSGGVTAYAMKTGKQLWHQGTPSAVLFGWQTDQFVYPGCGTGHAYRLSKKTGKVELDCKADTGIPSNASSPDDRYVFVGDGRSTIYCFDGKGERLWKLGTGCGSALSMQYHDEKLYIVTNEGTLACLDASEAAIKGAESGTLPKTREVKAPKEVAAVETTHVETTSDDSGGVVVECVSEGNKVRVHVVSSGYHNDWNVQFPRNLREPGARFVVDAVHEAAHGGFYRAHGDIRKLTAGAPAGAKKKKK